MCRIARNRPRPTTLLVQATAVDSAPSTKSYLLLGCRPAFARDSLTYNVPVKSAVADHQIAGIGARHQRIQIDVGCGGDCRRPPKGRLRQSRTGNTPY